MRLPDLMMNTDTDQSGRPHRQVSNDIYAGLVALNLGFIQLSTQQ